MPFVLRCVFRRGVQQVRLIHRDRQIAPTCRTRSGIVVLQLFNRERKSREEFEQINRDHMEAYKDTIFAYGWFYPVIEFLGMLVLALLLGYSGYQVNAGNLTLGIMVAFFQYGMRFFRPIQDLSEKYNILQAAMTASERIFKLLDTPVSVAAPALPRPADRLISSSTEFGSPTRKDWILRDVSFVVEPGETVAVVRHTGAGRPPS
jgi:ATP-binding cassette subfamily B protein